MRWDGFSEDILVIGMAVELLFVSTEEVDRSLTFTRIEIRGWPVVWSGTVVVPWGSMDWQMERREIMITG